MNKYGSIGASAEAVLPYILILTKKLESAPVGGRELLCKLNVDALKAIYGDRIIVFELDAGRLQGVRAYFNAFRGHIDGLNTESIDSAIRTIHERNVGKVFVDGSNLGGFIVELKRRLPKVEVTVFFHNCEAQFFWGSLCMEKTVRSFGVLLANTLAERKAVRHSDKRVCLSERDSLLLKKLYGREATHISPMALEDKMPVGFSEAFERPVQSGALFVGGTFYANRIGIAWFVKNVATRIEMPVYIVGRGFEALRSELEVPGKVTVVGEVDSLAKWYQQAQFVIAPIFDGSGMKTKVAEALMYGKKVIGTPEAFSGYEDIANQVGWVCSTADDFVAALKHAQREVTATFDADLRALYLKNFSLIAARARMHEIMEH
ncbi:MAG: glycosyltransferase [Halioglobus sp.]